MSYRSTRGSMAGYCEIVSCFLGGAEMKTSRWLIPTLSALFLTVTALAADVNLAERIRIQEERLPPIAQMAHQEREQVERWYARQRARTRQEEARERAAQLSLAQRTLWTEFAKMHQDRPYATGYFDAAQYGFPVSYEAAVLRYTMTEEYFVSEMASLLVDKNFRAKLVQIVDEPWQSALLQREARRLLDLMDTLDVELMMDLRQLENHRTEQLNAVAQREKELQEQVRTILDYLKRIEQRQPQLGVVESVGYSPQNGYFCTIEGVDKVLQPGDTAQGIQVVSIDPQKVTFAKNEITWTQGLGAPAQPHWE